MKNYLSKFTGQITKKKIILTGVAVIVILIVGYAVFSKSSNGDQTTLTVTRGEFVKEVSVSGKVVASDTVDLSFAETGRVANIAVAVGDKVTRGQRLANLSTDTLFSELAAAEASLAQTRAQNQNTETNLDKVKKEQDTLVASAYANLLSNDLVAVPVSNNTSATPPTITGRYNGGTEGMYKLLVAKDLTSSSRWKISTFGIEKTRDIEVLNDEATQLGTHGLFVSFPAEMAAYSNTDWTVSIPNTRSSTYLSVYNAYQEALRTRDRQVSSAESELVSGGAGSSVSQAEIANAEAEVARVRAQINERTIYAPFTGVITAVDAKLGGVASANTAAISMISADNLQIESYVPEIHIPFIKVGDTAQVTLDAYGADVLFVATVVSIDPAETIRDGVSTYRAKLEFSTPDERIKSGMTANVVVTSERKPDVLLVPQGAITTRGGQKFVTVKNGEATNEIEIAVGGISSFGEVEVLSGLNEGDVVVVPVTI